MMYLLIIVLGILSVFLYIRYFPVKGVKCIESPKFELDEVRILDVRDYNYAYKEPIQEAINIPTGYLKRNYRQISTNKVHVIATNQLEKNISIRFLRKKGFNVVGYTLTDCKCNPNIA